MTARVRRPVTGNRLGLAATLVICVCFGPAGCAHTPVQITRTAVLAPAGEPPSPASALLGYASRLGETTPAGRENAVRQARRQADREPCADTYAHLALALAAPHQRLYTPDEAARYARRALAARPTPWDRDARQYLTDVARLLEDADTRSQQDADTIAVLRLQLAAARNKLNAMSDIESQIDAADQP